MKALQTKINYKVPVILLLVATVWLACDNEDEMGKPVITNVRLTENPESVSDATFGQWVAIQGQNLASAQQVLFNTENAQLLTTFITDKNIVVQIPSTFPEEFTRKVKVITKGGIAEFDFSTGPAPEVTGFSNEFAAEGGTTKIIGSGFYDVDSVIFKGGGDDLNAQILEVTPSAIKVVVPVGAVTGTVKVVSAYGSDESSVKFRDETGMIMNFDDKNFCWGGMPIANGSGSGEPAPTSGKYMRGFKTNIPGEFWWDDPLVKATCGKIQDAVGQEVIGSSDQWVIKFELNVPEPWQYGHFEFALSWTYYYRFSPWKKEDGATAFTTDGWQTVTLPLNLLRKKTASGKPEGDPLTNVKDIADLVIYFQNPGPESVALLNANFDNVRIVKVK
jgi:hypothetical protein